MIIRNVTCGILYLLSDGYSAGIVKMGCWKPVPRETWRLLLLAKVFRSEFCATIKYIGNTYMPKELYFYTSTLIIYLYLAHLGNQYALFPGPAMQLPVLPFRAIQ